MLARQLTSNLLDNALLHNHPGGEARVTVSVAGRGATLIVVNTGPRVPSDQIERLLQPFRRVGSDRTADRPGHGLGLSIVAAIAAAHEATLDIRPNPTGGLNIDVSFPPAKAPAKDPTLGAPLQKEPANANRSHRRHTAAPDLTRHGGGPLSEP